MGLMKHLFIFGVVYMGQIQGNYVFTSIEENRRLKQFTEYPGLALKGDPNFEENNVVDYQQCIQTCDIKRPKCKAINVLKSGDTFTCSYFSTSSSRHELSADMIYISKDPPACFAYCEELDFMNLCGKCKCTNICGSKFNHFCNCTEALKEPKKDCKEIRKAGFKEPAMYNFKSSGGNEFRGFCEMREKPDVLWLTMSRRFTLRMQVINMGQLTDGFGQPHNEVYWLGLAKLHHFTKDGNTILRIEVATYSYHFKWYGEYGNFKVTKTGDSYGYTAKDFRSNFCLWDGLKNQGNFGECSGRNPWDGICQDSRPFRTTGIKWGGFFAQRITFLLRHGSLPVAPPLTEEMGVQIDNRHLGDIEHIGLDFCITFDLFTKDLFTRPSQHGNILCFPEKLRERSCVFGVYVPKNGNTIKIYHALTKDKTPITELSVDPRKGKWINLKLTQMRHFPNKPEYKFKVLVNDQVKDETDILSDLEERKHFRVALGKGITISTALHDGLIHGLYVNGKQYL